MHCGLCHACELHNCLRVESVVHARSSATGREMLARTVDLLLGGQRAQQDAAPELSVFLSLFFAGVVGRCATGRTITGMRGALGTFLLLGGPAVGARVMLLGELLGGCNGAPSAPPPPAGQGGRANLGTYPRATLRKCRCKQHRTHVAPALATPTLLLCVSHVLTRLHNSRSVHGMADYAK